MKEAELIKLTDHLINKVSNSIMSAKETSSKVKYVERPEYIGFRAASLSFIEKLYGKEHPFYSSFNHNVKDQTVISLNIGFSILKAIKDEIENGWFNDLKSLVAAAVFSDFLEMGAHLLEEGFKDAAAIIIGSVLEEHLRQLCHKYKIETFTIKDREEIPKKADLLNAELKKANVYSSLEQKQITAWQALRNSAAHGKYSDYTKEQVDLMYLGILNFVSTIK